MFSCDFSGRSKIGILLAKIRRSWIRLRTLDLSDLYSNFICESVLPEVTNGSQTVNFSMIQFWRFVSFISLLLFYFIYLKIVKSLNPRNLDIIAANSHEITLKCIFYVTLLE